MRLVHIIFIVGLACVTGCTTTARLRQRMINQGSTLPELQYQQVLNNLAQFAVNPSALPWHVNFKEGTSQVTDFLTGGAVVDLAPFVGTLTHPQLIGSRTAVAQWGRPRSLTRPSYGSSNSPIAARTASPICCRPSSSTTWPTS